MNDFKNNNSNDDIFVAAFDCGYNISKGLLNMVEILNLQEE